MPATSARRSSTARLRRSVSTTGDCRIVPRWDPKGHTRPWGKALFLKVTDGYLDEGDAVTVVFGDPSGEIQTRHDP